MSTSTATTATNKSNNQPQLSHAWESVKADAHWHSIHEDEDGNLISSATSSQSLAEQIRQRRKRLTQLDHAQSSRRILRDMIRYMYLVLDLSQAMYEKDSSFGFGPNKTRLDVMLQLTQEFVEEFFDQNPLSHLGIVIVKNGEAQVLSLLSGSKRCAAVALSAVREGVSTGLFAGGGGPKNAGEFSLQNGLEVAGRSLGHMPRHGSREIFVIVGALSTCDPGDVLVDTLPRLLNAHVRVNCLAMCAEMHVCRKISETSGGVMGVALDGRHMKDLLHNFIAPPPALIKEQNETQLTCEFVLMGLPTRNTETLPTLVHATSAKGNGSVARNDKLLLAKTSYVCPRCQAKVSELPTDCAVCGLKLVLAPHLARSFHHLFPVSPFVEIAEDVEVTEELSSITSSSAIPIKVLSLPPLVSSSDPLQKTLSLGFTKNIGQKKVKIDASILFSSKDCDRFCYGCLKVIGLREIIPRNKIKLSKNAMGKQTGINASNSNNSESLLRFQCPDCQNIFCADCDSFLHETLHNCPGCLCK